MMTLDGVAALELNGDEHADALSSIERRRAADVLSHSAGKWAADDALREKLCLLSNGELLVVQANNADADVLTYRDTLRRNGVPHATVFAQLSEIHEHYGRATGDASSQSASNRQAQVIDIVTRSMQAGATDVHFRVGRKVCEIYHRVHGDFERVKDMPAAEGKALCSTIYQSMCDVAETTFQPGQPQDGRLKQEFVERLDLWGARVATRPTDSGLVMVLRLLRSGGKEQTLVDLGYLDHQVEKIRRMTKMRSGITIFSGPTGSGKSTTQQVLMRELLVEREFRTNVLTIEDPPEYPIEGAVQTPLGTRGWEDGIRNMMRLDPDVLLIGEMRDLKSLQGAFRAALTGHGVYTTLHANDATAILQRMDDMGLDRGLMLDPAIVVGLINQNLAPTLCSCKVPYLEHEQDVPKDVAQRVREFCRPETAYLRGPGCRECNQRGIKGRTVIAEIISPNLEFMRIYRAEGKAEARVHWLKHMNGFSKIKHLIQRINEGLISPVDGEQAVGLLDSEAYA